MNLSGKNVLVTGADGFIGSHLTEKLVQLGANVTAFVQYNSFNQWGWIDALESEIKKNINVFTGDIREYDNVKTIVKEKEVVFHLAALIAIPYSYISPAAYVRTNVEGTLNIIQACLDFEIQKVVHTSTSEVYGTAQYVPIDEKHVLQGQSPYAASKIGADKMVESFFRSFDLPVATIRPFNTYGPRQSARAIIPTVISQILVGKKTIKLGALTPTRDFTYVQDTVNGFIRMAEVDNSIGKVINIGTNTETSIGDLVNVITDILGKKIDIDCEESRLRPEKSEVNRLWCDNTLASEILNWMPQYTLKEGLQETARWIGNNISNFKTDIFNV